MKKLCIILIMCAFGMARGQSPNWNWAKRCGSNNTDQSLFMGLDTSGNYYETGSFNSGSVTFGSFTILNTIGSTGFRNYILKRNALGVVLWAKALPISYSNHNFSIGMHFTDRNGNTYLWGDFSNTIVLFNDTFRPPPVGYSSFLMKVNATGNLVWFKKTNTGSVFKSPSQLGDQIVFKVAIQPFQTDTFGTSVFGPGAALVVMDTAGHYRKAVKLIDKRDFADYTDIQDVATNSNSTVFVLSYGTDSTLYNPLAWPAQHVAGREVQGQVAMFDSNLICNWVKSYAYDSLNTTPLSGEALFVGADDQNHAYLYGHMNYGKLRYDNTLPTPVSPYPYQGVFWAKINSNGSMNRLKAYSGSAATLPDDMLIDPIGNAYLIGRSSAGITYDTVTSPAVTNSCYIAKANSDLSMLWIKRSTGNSVMYPVRAQEDGKGNVFMSGSYYGSLVFGTDTLVCATPVPSNLTAGDAFVVKLGNCNLPLPAVSASGPLFWCGHDSVTLTATMTASYLWNTGDTTRSISIKNTGQFSYYASDAFGCYATSLPVRVQSFPTPHLVSTASAVKCFGGNDGKIVNTVSGGVPGYQFSCTPAVSGFGQVPAGSYLVNVTDTNGCKATDTVTVLQPQALVLTMDSAPSTSSPGNGKAIVMAAGGVQPYQYHWNTITPQNTDTATQLPGGWYAVTVTDGNSCDAVDSVYVRSYNSIEMLQSAVQLAITPNPSRGVFVVNLNGIRQTAVYTITDMEGKCYSRGNVQEGNTTIRTELPAGVYALSIQNGGVIVTKQLVIFK